MPSGLLHTRLFRLLLIIAVLAILGAITFVHRFLAVTRPTGRGVLVVEAWIPDQTLQSAASLFLNGSYRFLVVVGSQIERSNQWENYSREASAELARAGIPSDQIIMINLPHQETDRTRATAEAFKKWLLSGNPSIRFIDVYTVGVHARKSWIIFQSVLGPRYQVGVIAGPEPSYNPNYWLASPRGVYLVFRNVAGYLHSKYEIAVGTAR